MNSSLVQLHLGSNDISNKGFIDLFTCLKENNSIIDLNLSNQDSLQNRNRFNSTGACHALSEMLRCNKVLFCLNINGCTIGTEGLSKICPALNSSTGSGLAVLNLANNDFDTIEPLYDYLNTNRNL